MKTQAEIDNLVNFVRGNSMKPRMLKVTRCLECRWCLESSGKLDGSCANRDARGRAAKLLIPTVRHDTHLQDLNDIPDWCPLEKWGRTI
jgi:hypothetical protein